MNIYRQLSETNSSSSHIFHFSSIEDFVSLESLKGKVIDLSEQDRYFGWEDKKITDLLDKLCWLSLTTNKEKFNQLIELIEQVTECKFLSLGNCEVDHESNYLMNKIINEYTLEQLYFIIINKNCYLITTNDNDGYYYSLAQFLNEDNKIIDYDLEVAFKNKFVNILNNDVDILFVEEKSLYSDEIYKYFVLNTIDEFIHIYNVDMIHYLLNKNIKFNTIEDISYEELEKQTNKSVELKFGFIEDNIYYVYKNLE